MSNVQILKSPRTTPNHYFSLRINPTTLLVGCKNIRSKVYIVQSPYSITLPKMNLYSKKKSYSKRIVSIIPVQ